MSLRHLLPVGFAVVVTAGSMVVTDASTPSAAIVTSVTSRPAPARCDGLVATIRGTAGRDRLRGTPGRDVVSAGAGDDRVHALGGDDVVCGGDGRDLLVGGPGDDRLYGQRDVSSLGGLFAIGDQLRGGPGDDLLDVGRDDRAMLGEQFRNVVDYSDATSGVTVRLDAGRATGQGRDVVVPRRDLVVFGSRHDDLLVGRPGPDLMTGLAGDDVLRGLGGNDQLLADSRPNATTNAGIGDDTLDGGAGADVLVSEAGTDVLRGGGGDDQLEAAPADDRSAAPSLFGGRGTDRLRVTLPRFGGLVLDAGPGVDYVFVFREVVAGEGPTTVDFAAETITRVSSAGTAVGRLTHDERDKLKLAPVSSGSLVDDDPTPWVFHGSEGADTVGVTGRVVDSDLGPGDDTISTQVYGGGRVRGLRRRRTWCGHC